MKTDIDFGNVYVIGPRKVGKFSLGRGFITIPKDLYPKLKGKKVMVILKVLE